MESKVDNSKRLLTSEQKRKCEELESSAAPHAKEVAQQYRRGKIDTKTFEEAREVLRDPNKMQQDSYKHFMKALAKGKFPDRAQGALPFLKALKGSDEEQKYAKELLKELKDDASGPLSSRREKDALEKLKELRTENLAKNATSETRGTVAAITTTADIHAAVENSSETGNKNWRVEKPPKELIDQMNELEFTKTKAILQKIEAKEKELDEAVKAGGGEEVIATLEAEIAKLDEEFEAIREELEQVKRPWLAYLQKIATRYDGLEKVLNRSGIDINSARRIKLCMADSTGDIKILNIHFKNEKTDGEPQSPGELLIDYINEKGETVTDASYKVFLNLLTAFGGYEEMETLEEVNERIAVETLGVNLDVGQEFNTDFTVGLNEKGEPLKEQHTFKIQAIDKKKKTITLDRVATTVPRQLIANSVDPTLYFDRKKREFSYGEFAGFVKRHGYTRKPEASEKEKILPNGKDIIFIDSNRRQRWGSLALDQKTGNYFITPADVQGENLGKDYIKAMLESGVPMAVAAVPPASTGMSNEDLQNLQNITPARLHKMFDNGDIINAPTEAPAGKGRWVLRKNPHSKAAITMTNKDDTAETPATPNARPETPAPTAETTEDQPITRHKDSEPVEEQEKPKEKKAKFYDEALPYDDIFKTGGMSGKQTNFLLETWKETRFMSVNDLWEMGKAMWQYYDNRFQRRQKAKYSQIGKNLPFWAPEMQRISQSAENEQVNQFKESFEQQGVYQIQERLRRTRNRDEMKACYITLSDKGQLRWDDITMWKNLNRFVDAGIAVPIPSNGDPNTRISKDDPRTGFDYLKAAIDSLWGEGQYNSWFSKNKSTFQSGAKSYYEEGKQLEGVDGGHGRRLKVLLQQHKMGEFVDPHEYEGLILHSIEAGKSRMQEKIYFMIEGVAAENMHGRTILPFDRMAHLNSEMLTRFPILEYLCASVPRPPDGKAHRFTIDDYKEWVRMFDDGDSKNPDKNFPGKYVDRFMWEKVIPSDETQNRINKAIRNGESLDHDDMFAYLPPATEEVLTDSCKATTGSKKFLTIEGYANAFPGFSEYMRSLAASGNKGKLREAIKSYMRFEGIMTNKYEKGKDSYQRMGYATLNGGTIVTPTPPQAFITEMNGAIKEIVQAYDDSELNDVYKWMNTPTPNFRTSKEDQDKQKKVDEAFDKFGDVFTRVVKGDNGDKMISLMAGARLEGIPRFLSSEETDQRKATYSDKMALD